MQEVQEKSRGKYKKKNQLKINIIYDDKGKTIDEVLEEAFGNYCIRENFEN